jgi:hypothetical protein
MNRRASTHAPIPDTLDKSSARTRQTAQHRMRMAYVHGPLTLDLDLRIFDIPLEERLQSQRYDLVDWTKTMLPGIRHSISEAWKVLRTGHQDIRNHFSDMAAPERTMNATLTTVTAASTTTDRIGPRPTAFR